MGMIVKQRFQSAISEQIEKKLVILVAIENAAYFYIYNSNATQNHLMRKVEYLDIQSFLTLSYILILL